ncbi:hypothetical protein, conserved [Eimeria tenella]|uniref:RNA helicase n=1 Tax=Eimeria tenella TaxID=5802 RepID=U6KRN2_EIMTE|nr:hypothetical protein, conserved [Eimeria tenella]CDJ39573.1 hypothetical protein, conserved [Eimeria tenella]|eukprot:XP_013230328.1 hypothetical protein, conserved [Eimeria tenella]
MSATLDPTPLRAFLRDPGIGIGIGIVSIPHVAFPLKAFFAQTPQEDYLQAALLTVLQIHLGNEDSKGDILVFLPGQEEIEALGALLHAKLQQLNKCGAPHPLGAPQGAPEGAPKGCGAPQVHVRLGSEVYVHRRSSKLLVCCLYAALPFEQQQEVLKPVSPPFTRKVILATNIAETSLTIPGVRFVVDSGLKKSKVMNYKTHVEALQLQEISKDSADQRAGRAAREGPDRKNLVRLHQGLS